jgi:hypothetical protein
MRIEKIFRRFAAALVCLALVLGGFGPVRAGDDLVLPNDLLERLRTDIDWDLELGDGPKPLGSHYLVDLGPDRLLIVLQIPNYLGAIPNMARPLVVDLKKKSFSLGQELYGAINLFGRGPDGRLWVSTQSQIEATYPSLYSTMDGAVWTEETLPAWPEGGTPFLMLEAFCPLANELWVDLREMAGDPVDRRATFKRNSGGQWKEALEKGKPAPLPTCVLNGQTAGVWTRTLSKDKRSALVTNGRQTVVLPADLRK